MKRKLASIALTGALLIGTIGCTSAETNSKNTKTTMTSKTTTSASNSGTKATNTKTTSNTSTSNNTTTSSNIQELVASDMFSNKDKEVGYDATQAKTIKLENKSITISQEGTYILSGSISNGQVIVDAPDTAKIRIILNGVNINNDTSAAIYVKKADKVFLTTAKGTTNTLSNKKEFVNTTTEEINAVIYSKEDITLNGQGTLNINAVYGNGVVSKDDLVITSGTYNINAANHGLRGKDSVKIADGIINVTAKKDAIHGENNDDATKGYVYIGGGKLNLKSESDAIDTTSILQVDGGQITITATDDAMHSEDRLIIKDGTINILQSEEGIEGKRVDIKGGTINLKSNDDGINATSGSTTQTTSADNSTTNNNNTTTKTQNTNNKNAKQNTSQEKMPEMNGQRPPEMNGQRPPEMNGQRPPKMNGQRPPEMNGQRPPEMNGQRPPKMNGQRPPEMNGQRPPEMNGQRPPEMNGHMMRGGKGGGDFEVDKDAYINISGGKITILANGDGIDSNGSLSVTGGTVYVSGPNNGGNGSLDYNGEGTITGGTVITAGASGMNQNFGSSSTQGSILLNNIDSQKSGTKIEVKDSTGKVIASYTPEKDYNSILVSSPQIKKGAKYTITAGSYTKQVEMTSLIYGESSQMGGNFGGGKDARDEQFQNQKSTNTINTKNTSNTTKSTNNTNMTNK